MAIAFNRTITLDNGEFDIASSELRELSIGMNDLKITIEEMLESLAHGFNTPAGKIFINSCRNNLLEPLSDQALVLGHIADNLDSAKGNYQEVFAAYQRINNAINTT